MNDVLILIGYRTLNYGSALQAAATGYMIHLLGKDYKILNTDSLQKGIKKKKILFYLTSGELSFFLHSKGRFLLNRAAEKYKKPYRLKLQSRRQKFNVFLNKYLLFTKDVKSWEEAGELAEKYKNVLLGSDQMWLPSSVVTDTYTLHFVAPDINMLSYATSFGIGTIPEKFRDNYIEMFKHIKNVSVREVNGVRLFHEMMGYECPLTLDPVLMLDKNMWEALIPNNSINIHEPYVFCYFLGNNKWQRRWVLRFAKKYRFKLVGLIHCDEYIKNDEKIYDYSEVDISPESFLNYIRNACYIFTDSFHCSALSVIEEKKFGVFLRFSDYSVYSTNSRIYSFLEQTGLKSRLVTEGTSFHFITADITYDLVNQRIEKMREESFSFLRKNIKSGNE